MSRTLLEYAVVTEQADPGDDRRRLLALSPQGRALMEGLAPVWTAISGAVAELDQIEGGSFLAGLAAIERALDQRSLGDRIRSRLAVQRGEEVEIIPFEPRYADDFKRLNLEWLEKYFYVEAVDNDVLSRPVETILDRGGFIFLARYQGATVGTCALIRAGRGRFELSKMAVTEQYQGLGIGRRLLAAALARYRQARGEHLFLESSTKLTRALALYEAHGFRRTRRPQKAPQYGRSDVYMVFRPGRRSRRTR